MPRPLVKVLLAAHIGTGCDTLSRIGTKLAALNAILEIYLKGFGKRELDEAQVRKCEEYLVKVLKLSTECVTFDSLRSQQYRNNDSIFDLPPTSHSIVKGHIPRWHYLVKDQSNILNRDHVPLDPCDSQWVLENEELLPVKHLHLLPEELTVTCSCKNTNIDKRCNGRCKCLKEGVLCNSYCVCQKICCNTVKDRRPPKRKQPLKSSRNTRKKTTKE